MIMKKLIACLSFLLTSMITWSQNVNSFINIYISSYETGWVNGYYEKMIFHVANNSDAQLMLVDLKMYNYSDNSIIYYSSDLSNPYLNPYSALAFTYNNDTGSKVIMEQAWVIELQYFNMQTGGTIIKKKALKRANTIGTNMSLEDISEDNPNPSTIVEEIVINDFCYDLDLTSKEAKLRNSSQVSYSGNIVIPTSVNYQGEEYQVTSIKTGTFSNNWNVTSVSIPSSIKIIESSAFSVCLKMTQLSIAEGLEEIGYAAFYNCNGLTIVTLPNSVKTIKQNAFWGCHSLSTVVLGSSVSDIGYYAFNNCNKLSDFYCYATNVPDAKLSFDSSVSNATLHVPASSLPEYKSNFNWDDFKNIVAITDSDPKPTGIIKITESPFEVKRIISLDGIVHKKPQKGLNIVIDSDGKTRKVVMK